MSTMLMRLSRSTGTRARLLRVSKLHKWLFQSLQNILWLWYVLCVLLQLYLFLLYIHFMRVRIVCLVHWKDLTALRTLEVLIHPKDAN